MLTMKSTTSSLFQWISRVDTLAETHISGCAVAYPGLLRTFEHISSHRAISHFAVNMAQSPVLQRSI